MAEGYSEWKKLKEEVQQLRSDERDRARMIDLYQFQAREIADARLAHDDEEKLLADRNRLANAEKLHEAVSTAFGLIGDRINDRCALDAMSEAVTTLIGIAGIDPALDPMMESLQTALYQAEDAARELRAYRDAIQFNPELLEAIEERLDLIRNLKRKYGETVLEIIEYGDSLQGKLDALVNSDERLAQLDVRVAQVHSKAMADAVKLSEMRRAGADVFTKAVEGELEGLGMANAVFEMSMAAKELHSGGIDDAEFLISANPGEPPRPLAKIASGGEMSRVMLAIKSVMAGVDRIPTLVFDEIDVGVWRSNGRGGRQEAQFSRAERTGIVHHASSADCITFRRAFSYREAASRWTDFRARTEIE